MAWIRVIDPEEASGALKEYYDEIKKARGKVANIMKIHSLRPETMKRHLELYLSIMFARSGLGREQRELLATVISSVNRCAYCVQHHGEALHHYWNDAEKLERVKTDYTQLNLGERDRSMLDYGVKLTRDPAAIGEDDIQRLRDAGYSDEDVLTINLIVSYFNFVNRVAEGLGVEFTPEEARGYEY